MRVISGSARGKRLVPVSGMATRPTTDRVKESVFNILQGYIVGCDFLDMFAGTGQMGIEALSRGAKSAVFCDKERNALSVIKKNIQSARVDDRAEIIAGDFHQNIERMKNRQFDVIFLDPPYGGEILNDALKSVELFDILRPDGIIVCESSVQDRLECPSAMTVKKQYKYGAILLTSIIYADTENTNVV